MTASRLVTLWAIAMLCLSASNAAASDGAVLAIHIACATYWIAFAAHGLRRWREDWFA